LKQKRVKPKKSNVKKHQAVSGCRVKKQDGNNATKQLNKLMFFLWRPKLLLSMIVGVTAIITYPNIDIGKFLPITSIKIEGEFTFLKKQQLHNRTMSIASGGFFDVDLSAIRKTLVEMPWVEEVSIRRQWPDKLLVRVIEKKPVGFWGKKGMISTKGEFFVPEHMPEFELPHLFGPQGQHKNMLQKLARMQAWLLATGLRIVNVELNARRSWTLTMRSGLELRLGRNQIQERLNRFVSVYDETLKIDKRAIKYIDMRYTNGFSVAWKKA